MRWRACTMRRLWGQRPPEVCQRTPFPPLRPPSCKWSQEMAYRAAQKAAWQGKKFLDDLEDDAKASGAQNVPAVGDPGSPVCTGRFLFASTGAAAPGVTVGIVSGANIPGVRWNCLPRTNRLRPSALAAMSRGAASSTQASGNIDPAEVERKRLQAIDAQSVDAQLIHEAAIGRIAGDLHSPDLGHFHGDGGSLLQVYLGAGVQYTRPSTGAFAVVALHIADPGVLADVREGER